MTIRGRWKRGEKWRKKNQSQKSNPDLSTRVQLLLKSDRENDQEQGKSLGQSYEQEQEQKQKERLMWSLPRKRENGKAKVSLS